MQVAKYYPPYPGGIERVVEDLSLGLRDAYDTRVLACTDRPGPARHERLDGIPVTRAGLQTVALRVPLALGFYSWYRRLLRRADLVQFHLPFPAADAAALLAGLDGVRSVAWYHCDVVRHPWAHGLYGILLRRFLRKVDRILVASRGLLESSPFLAEVREKCTLVPYGVGPHGPAEAFPLPKDFVLFVGRLVDYKGVDVLLEAMRGIPAPLVVAGDGPRRESLRRRAAELGLDGRVHFLGRLSAARLQHCFRSCRLLVLPSVDRSEAFGLVQLEAMAHGKPVVNTRLPTGVPEVSLDGRSGLTVPPGDPDALAGAVRRILDDGPLHEALSAGAAARAGEFSMDRFLAGMRRCYDEVLDAT